MRPRHPPAKSVFTLTAAANPGIRKIRNRMGTIVSSPEECRTAMHRSLDGELDLYVKQVAGGQPIRLTFDGAGNTTPDFSPNGSKIVFRSNRDGGGIYEIPAFGGDVRLVARDGLNPKYSPDGSQVAYWVGAPDTATAVPGTGTVWVIPV